MFADVIQRVYVGVLHTRVLQLPFMRVLRLSKKTRETFEILRLPLKSARTSRPDDDDNISPHVITDEVHRAGSKGKGTESPRGTLSQKAVAEGACRTRSVFRSRTRRPSARLSARPPHACCVKKKKAI